MNGNAMNRPNVILLFADQLRGQALGFMGDPNVKTPHLDKLAKESVVFSTAVSSCPVCSPARASLLTGQSPLTHGVILNDVYLPDNPNSMAHVFAANGYDTAYIGKWHLDGHGSRSIYIPRDRRQGFDYWKVLECTHDYNTSKFYANDDPTIRVWEGYDAIAQTRDALQYIRSRTSDRPFLLVLSWGPPHNPYNTAPPQFQRLYPPKQIKLRPNVPRWQRRLARRELSGYYAHVSALDSCIGEILTAIREKGLDENTIVAFWSDHGDMLQSHGETRKQKPWDESILVPLLVRYPEKLGKIARIIPFPLCTEDIYPTVLGLCGITVPQGVQGTELSAIIMDPSKSEQENRAVLIATYWPFSEWPKQKGGKEYRGIRTRRNTYVRTLSGPWLLFDNIADPFQLRNVCNRPEYRQVQQELDERLKEKLKENKDEFLPGETYLKKHHYQVGQSGAAHYTN